MKLLKTLPILVSGEWTQPTYWDAQQMARQRSNDWAHPVGIRAAADWQMCPQLSMPAGVAGYTCAQATCMVNCEPGKIAMGRRRMKCRFKRKKGFFWRQVRRRHTAQCELSQLSHCGEVLPPIHLLSIGCLTPKIQKRNFHILF